MEFPGAACARWVLLGALCLWGPQPGDSKVYYSCGAVLSSIERGLILSPGFPAHYHPGAHCVWQFFVPRGTHLILEMFDFDVFESSDEDASSDGYVYPLKGMSQETTLTEKGEGSSPVPTSEPFVENPEHAPDHYLKSKGLGRLHGELLGDTLKKDASGIRLDEGPTLPIAFEVSGRSHLQRTLKAIFDANQPRWRQENNDQDSTKDGRAADEFNQDTARGQNKAEARNDKYPLPQPEATDSSTSSAPPWMTDTSSEMLLPAEICAQDVLYISDLVTFSARFCGTNSPVNKTLMFGSSVEMMEVIMELITTTSRGRGFLMLFDYQNASGVTAMNFQGHPDGENQVMLAIIAGVAAFATVVLGALCLVSRRRMCAKRSPSSTMLDEQESGIQNVAVDFNELQLVVPGRENENNNHSVGQGIVVHTGEQQETPRKALMDPASSISASGSDEVFVISAGRSPRNFDFATYPVQNDSILRRSMTSPSSVSDWQTWDPSATGSDAADQGDVSPGPDPPRRRTWSVRTFHDILAPLPKLQKKWCSWSTGSPFTKLVDSGTMAAMDNPSEHNGCRASSASPTGRTSERLHSESSISNVSYPPSQSAQRQRRVYSGSLKKSRFGSPYFGFRASSPDGGPIECSRATRDPCPNESLRVSQSPGRDISSFGKSSHVNNPRTKDVCVEIEKPKPAFVISEEEDQQPLVLSEQLSTGGDIGLAEEGVTIDLSEPGLRPSLKD